MIKVQGNGPLLCVDDSEDDIDIIRRCFERSTIAATYALHTFNSGTTFLDHMRLVAEGSEPFPSIVLLDVNMPEMNGFEVLRALRSADTFVELPAVIFVSNGDRPTDIELAQMLNADFREKFDRIGTGVDFFNSLI